MPVRAPRKEPAPPDALAAGVRDARWPARLQRLHDGALPAAAAAAAGAAVEVWVDGGHNPAAGEALAPPDRRLVGLAPVWEGSRDGAPLWRASHC